MSGRLLYNYFRDYSSDIGRYWQSDPIGLDGGGNIYAYIMSNPLLGADPKGLARCILVFSNRKGNLHCESDPSSKPITIDMPVSSGNNGNGSQCKNNPECDDQIGQGPIPRGWWQWTSEATAKPNGRSLRPLPGTDTHYRTLIRSHSCLNAFGASTSPPYCSEGCVTGSAADMKKLNDLLDSEPGSLLYVTDRPFWD